MIRVTINGIGGRMGREVAKIIYNLIGMELVGGIEKLNHSLVSIPIRDPELRGVKIIGDADEEALFYLLDFTDVIIDFSAPESTMKIANLASKKGVPMVIGTTGLTEENLRDIKVRAKSIPILQSFNMSLGMNLLFSFVEKAAAVLGNYDAEIIEKHHRLKKDAPSGSAVSIGKIIANARDVSFDEAAVYARQGMIGERKPETIGIQTVRGGSIVGEHEVLFIGDKEILEITHRAMDRSVFALGAAEAARWIRDQPRGIYTMKDFLHL